MNCVSVYSFFIFGCVGSPLLCTGFLRLWRLEAPLRCGAWASHSGGFCCGARALEHTSLSSCGAQAQWPCSIWNLPGPGIEPTPPALAGRFPTTGPSGSPRGPFVPELGRARPPVHGHCPGPGQVAHACSGPCRASQATTVN